MSARTEASFRRGWLRRNLLALVVIALALPLLALVVVVLPFLSTVSDDSLPVVKQGESVEMNGYTFTLTKSEEFVGTGTGNNGNDIPIGSSLVGALIEIEATDSAEIDGGVCLAALTSRTTGVERLWEQLSDAEEFGYGVGEDHDDFCGLEGESLGLEVVFLTPKGAYDGATVDVTLQEEAFRFELVQ